MLPVLTFATSTFSNATFGRTTFFGSKHISFPLSASSGKGTRQPSKLKVTRSAKISKIKCQLIIIETHNCKIQLREIGDNGFGQINRKAIHDLCISHYKELIVEELWENISEENFLNGNDEVTEMKLRSGATSTSKLLMA